MKALLTVTSNQAAQLANHFVSADGTGRIAIICPNDLIKPVREAVRHRLSSLMAPSEYQRLIDQPEWDEQISVCGTVIVIEPGRIEDDAPSRLVAASDLYVATTRPTQKLIIVRTKEDERSLNI